MAKIKTYRCGICKKGENEFSSTRKEVRKHLREVHGVKGQSMKDKEGSSVSSLTISEVMK